MRDVIDRLGPAQAVTVAELKYEHDTHLAVL